MDLDTRLWREASVSADVEVFLDHVGAQLLDDLRVEALAVRSIDGEGHRLERAESRVRWWNAVTRWLDLRFNAGAQARGEAP